MSKSKGTSESSQEATLNTVYRSINENKKKKKKSLMLVHVALEFAMVRVNFVDVEVICISGVNPEFLQTPSHPRVFGRSSTGSGHSLLLENRRDLVDIKCKVIRQEF
jgi:hypothetical protein